MQLETSSDSISTDDNNDIVLKLIIKEEDVTQIRMVHLEEIIDPESHKPVFQKLVNCIRRCLLAQHVDPRAIKLNYQKVDTRTIKISYQVGNEEIVVGSNFELDYAIRQSSDAHMVTLTVDVKGQMTPSAAPAILPDNIVLQVTVEKEYPETRIVQLKEIFDYESQRPSYEKLMERVGHFLNQVVDPMTVKLSYVKDNKVIFVGSTMELVYAIHQSGGVPIVSFMAHIGKDNTEPFILPENVPTNLASHGLVAFRKVTFDSSCESGLMQFSNQNRCVTRSVNNRCTWASVYAKEGFESGCHYWSLKVINKEKGNILIGVGSATGDARKTNYPGHENHPGCALNLYSGHVHSCSSRKNSAGSNASIVTKATTIGVLLNMDNTTVTFYADRERLEMPEDTNGLTASKYYPVVSLYNSGGSVAIEDLEYSY